MANDEMVWVIPRTVLFEEIGSFDGFRRESGSLDEFAARLEGSGTFRPRAEVEDDPSLKQIIPYIAIEHDGRFLRLRRLRTQGEARLHDRLSIGIGGHINPEPEDGRPLLWRGLEREMCEELRIDRPLPPVRLVGCINDDATSVGAVHFGVACVCEVEAPVEIRETDRMEGTWATLDEIATEREHLESWSAFLIDGLRAQ